MNVEIGIGIAIQAPLSGVGTPGISFFGDATILGQHVSIRGNNRDDQWHLVVQLVSPSVFPWLKEASLGWTPQTSSTGAAFLTSVSVKAELGLTTTPIRVTLDTTGMSIESSPAGTKHAVRIPFGTTTQLAPTSSIETFAAAESTEEASTGKWKIDGPISLEPLLSKLTAFTDGASTTSRWGDYLGECLELENIGVTPSSTPKPNLLVTLNANTKVGTWLSIAVRRASVRLTVNDLSSADIATEFNVESVALRLDIPSVAKAEATMRHQHDHGTHVLAGLGRLALFDALNVGMLVHFEWRKHEFVGAVGFVLAKGFALGPPSFRLTGLGGGFSHHRILILPDTAEAVANHHLVKLLQSGDDEDAFEEAAGGIESVGTFLQNLAPRPHALGFAFALTFKIAMWIDCVALLVADVRKQGFDLALLGVADFSLGTSSRELGHVQLALLARGGSNDDSLRILGALTSKSWLLHPNCRIHGGFAIAAWFHGEHAGDFVVSLGGYSPLLPPKRHYPQLERIGFTWNVTSQLRIFGYLYFALDRYGAQFGARAGLKFTSAALDVDARFSFDALAQWMPAFFQARFRVGVHVELRAIVTLRLGLVVDMEVFGPPFGAELHLELEIKIWKSTLTLRAGAAREIAQRAARALPSEVLALAKGGRPDALQLVCLAKTQSCGDDCALSISSSIPIKHVYRQTRALESRHSQAGDQLDVRPLGWQNVISDLIWNMDGPTEAKDWQLTAIMSRPVEALWYVPPNDDLQGGESGRKCITGIRLVAPEGRLGDAGLAKLGLGSVLGMYDHYLPGVRAGTYRLRVHAQLKPNEQTIAWHDETKEHHFTIDAPRFSFAGFDEIRDCSPPPGGRGDYHSLLPQLVFDKRALPWERPIEPDGPELGTPTPWLALILLTAEEMAADGAVLNEIMAERLAKPPAVNSPFYSPWSDPRKSALRMRAEETQQKVTVLELSAPLFRRLCPRIEELALLAHVRRVSLAEKPDHYLRAERDFAVVLGNRLVQPGENVALLISLEGWTTWFEDPNHAPDKPRARVVVLRSWKFVSEKGDTSFAAQINALNVGTLVDDDALARADEPTIRRMLGQGYTAIAYQPEDAEKTFAWYRGPLAPVEVPRLDEERAAEAEHHGMRDISYSTAWQLGRLLGLGSAPFGQAIRHWNYLKQLDALNHPDRLDERKSIAEEMDAYFSNRAVEAARDAAIFEDVKTVGEWLAALLLLHPVPLRYLLPAAQLLPPNSLRFFHIDENWLDALADGALSLGASSPGAKTLLGANRVVLRAAIRRLMLRLRGVRKNLPQEVASPPAEEDRPICGFLLRSPILNRFRSIEVEIVGSRDDDEKPKVVRMELVGEGILLVLVAGKPEGILFKMPREALTFAHDDGKLTPRVTDANAADFGTQNRSTSPLDLALYDQGAGIIDVRRLARDLEGIDDQSGARYALHWQNDPDDVFIRWDHFSAPKDPR